MTREWFRCPNCTLGMMLYVNEGRAGLHSHICPMCANIIEHSLDNMRELENQNMIEIIIKEIK